jgi:hypothetical protein
MHANHTRFALALLPLLAACGGGDWVVTTWGEEYIEEGIPSAEFEDGCEAVFDTFTVALTEAALLDGDGEVAGSVETGSFEMTEAGPQTVGTASVAATHYDTARFVVAPAGGPSVRAAGTLTCGGDAVSFDWSFETSTTYLCEPADLTVPAGGEAGTELTIHGDHFFYDGLENPDAALRGQAIVDADADGDGVVTLDELAAVDVAGLGYAVGQYSEVTDLAAFITFLTRTLGHVDSEGHCQVDL